MQLIVTDPQTGRPSARPVSMSTCSAAKPDAVLGLATGSTPLGLYARLAALYRAGELSFRRATSFNLDEYVGLPATHSQSYRYFMEHNLFSHVDLPAERTHVPSGLDVSDAALAGYDAAIEAAGGIDPAAARARRQRPHRLQRAGHAVRPRHARGGADGAHAAGQRALLRLAGRGADARGDDGRQDRHARAGDPAARVRQRQGGGRARGAHGPGHGGGAGLRCCSCTRT